MLEVEAHSGIGAAGPQRGPDHDVRFLRDENRGQLLVGPQHKPPTAGVPFRLGVSLEDDVRWRWLILLAGPHLRHADTV
ncbi:hypothetical protein GCM10027300_42150 [Modestobacter lapidis]